jgi:hypothetical protein
MHEYTRQKSKLGRDDDVGDLRGKFGAVTPVLANRVQPSRPEVGFFPEHRLRDPH